MTDKQRRPTDADYAEMAKDYAENPPTVEEVLSVEVDPAFVIGDDATIEDADLDQREITYQGKRLTEADVLKLDEEIATGQSGVESDPTPSA
ncbi:hypothetical protein [Mycolicibacterium sphagni]|uniref:Uncharacterized protein n=1 Tax=Mycolicibacterium sphagni TaxID=1786 RepID=A0ABX2JQ79_9MYCO|nr:hypothetical protein [Mycolicibacterium sphagni]NTY58728.1 hypothetical protein [Mycolicibacterium sphagni]